MSALLLSLLLLIAGCKSGPSKPPDWAYWHRSARNAPVRVDPAVDSVVRRIVTTHTEETWAPPERCYFGSSCSCPSDQPKICDDCMERDQRSFDACLKRGGVAYEGNN